jgi:hypothetical protein
MNSNTPFLTFGERWPFVKPAFPQPPALEAHGKLPPSISYPAGQALGYHAGSGTWRAPGTGVGIRRRILKYQCTTDANGNASFGPTALGALDTAFETVPMYTTGAFFVKDLTGIAADADVAELGQTNGHAYNDAAAVVVLNNA